MAEPARPEQVIKKTDGMTVIKPVITRKRQLYKKKVDAAPPPDQGELGFLNLAETDPYVRLLIVCWL